MPLVPLRLVLDHAAENNYGVGAFNVNNMEQIQAIMEAAKETDSPVIVQASRGARSYSQDNYLRHLMLAASELYPEIPVVMHQDHGNSPTTCFSAIKYGFTSVMMDGSLMDDAKTPSSFDYNVGVTREVVQVAHSMGVSVEGEIGCLGQVGHAPVAPKPGTSKPHDADLEKEPGDTDGHDLSLEKEPGDTDGHAPTSSTGGMDSSHLTDPDEAEQFVAATKVDALAVAIGTSHGAYKFKHKPTGEVLKMTLIEEIHRRLPNTHLVMHGSSSVPEDLQEIIRKYGGKMEETYGVPVSEIQRGIKHGVRKINVDTDCRMAITGAIRKVFAENPKAFDPRDYMKPARDAMRQVVIARMTAFGQAGNASKMRAAGLVR